MEEESAILYMGTLNSEYFWRDKGFSKLPTFIDHQANAVVTAMDEMFFIFCNYPADRIITRYPMDVAHKNYLEELGFNFKNNEIPIDNEEPQKSLNSYQSVCQLLLQTKKKKYFRRMISSASRVSPYSILPSYDSFCKAYDVKDPIPSINTVKKVNSKVYSHRLVKDLFGYTVGKISNSASEISTIGNMLLKTSPFLIKDPYGVSGIGIVLISSERMLKRIVAYFSKQEKQGQKTQFILEPLLDKYLDFSCQFEINSTGKFSIISLQQMQNTGFSFSGAHAIQSKLRQRLESSGYFRSVKLIANELYAQGYFGPVCLDSMILRNGTIVPVVEINARKSMGMISHLVDRFLSKFSVSGMLISFSLVLPRDFDFDKVIHKMKKKKILFQKETPLGILPLSANTLLVNLKFLRAQKPQAQYKGKFYGVVVYRSTEEYKQMITKINNVFMDLGAKCFT